MYIGNDLRSGRSETYVFTASGSETAVTASDDSRSINYTVGWVKVWLNGVLLVEGSGKDFQATTGSSITGLAALSASDVVTVEANHTHSTSDSVPATGGTFSGPVITTGLITANGGVETSTTTKIKQKGSFLQSSFHQALTLGG
jgi:hypothetical protein